MFKRTAPVIAEPTVEETFSTASGSSAYTKGTFRDAIDDLTLANTSFAEVESRAAVEIARLDGLRAEAAAQRQANARVIENLRTLLGE